MIRRNFRRVEATDPVDGVDRNRSLQPGRSTTNNQPKHASHIKWIFMGGWMCLLIAIVRFYGEMIATLHYSSSDQFSQKEPQNRYPQNSNEDDELSSFWYRTKDHKADPARDDNKVIYVGMYGLGHRLSKMAGAYHFAKQLVHSSPSSKTVFPQNFSWPVTHFEVLWGTCGASNSSPTGKDDTDIFDYLFGNNRISLGLSNELDKNHDVLIKQQSSSETDMDQQGKSLVIRNDVAGYYAGQIYKNARVPISPTALTVWEEKIESDLILFRNLVQAFDRKFSQSMIYTFQQQYKWEDHFVIGLHIRAGNGEQDHFEQAQRQIQNQATFYQDLAQTVSIFWKEQQKTIKDPKSLMIFLATDTASVLDTMTQLFGKYEIPVVSVPQPRVEENQGVSYATWTEGAKCRQGWLYSMVDMSLLTKSQMVIAACRSTFAQILPRSLVLDDTSTVNLNAKRYRFCEASDSGRSIMCFSHRDAWLFRGQISIPTANAYHVFGVDTTETSSHKIMVHFPDPVFFGYKGKVEVEDPDLQWLRKSQQFWDLSQTQDLRMLYGSGKIAKKYRRPQKGIKKEFQLNWTFA